MGPFNHFYCSVRGCSAGCAAGGCSLCSALEHVNNHYTCLNNSAAAARCSSQQQRPGAGWKYGLHQRAAGTDTASHQAAATQITAKPRCYAAKHRYVDIFIDGRAKVFTLFVSPSCLYPFCLCPVACPVMAAGVRVSALQTCAPLP